MAKYNIINTPILMSVLLVSALTGCVSQMRQADEEAKQAQFNTPVEVKVTVPFDEKQAKSAMALGAATVRGVLYHKVTRGGKYAGEDAALTLNPAEYIANVDVVLFPVTAHLQEWMRLEEENRGRKLPWAKDKQLKRFIADDRMFKYMMFTKTDEHGRYSFSKLKSGRYFVMAADLDVTSTGTETVGDGYGVVSNGWGVPVGTVQQYRNQNFRVKTPIRYQAYIEVKSGQKELVLESRMRMRRL